jgi:hypothetical protein
MPELRTLGGDAAFDLDEPQAPAFVAERLIANWWNAAIAASTRRGDVRPTASLTDGRGEIKW